MGWFGGVGCRDDAKLETTRFAIFVCITILFIAVCFWLCIPVCLHCNCFALQFFVALQCLLHCRVLYCSCFCNSRISGISRKAMISKVLHDFVLSRSQSRSHSILFSQIGYRIPSRSEKHAIYVHYAPGPRGRLRGTHLEEEGRIKEEEGRKKEGRKKGG